MVEFPPHGVRTVPINPQVDLVNDFEGQIVDYRRLVLDWLVRPELPYRVHRTVVPGWDNTARRPNLALTFVNATPEIYELWLREIVARAVERQQGDERLVFINAWNEWAEAAHSSLTAASVASFSRPLVVRLSARLRRHAFSRFTGRLADTAAKRSV